MGPQNAPPPADEVIAAMAARQYGVAGRGQLLAAGVSATQLARRVRTGQLIRLHRAVYAVGHAALTFEGRWLAAVLACGPGAALSHRAAAALRGLRREWLRWLEVSTARSVRRVPGVIVHRPRALPPGDVTVERGVPVTTVARTLADLADVVSERVLARVIEEAEVQRLHAPVVVIPGRRGAGRLEAALSELRVRVPQMTRSELERRFLDLCRTAGLPLPDANVTVEGTELDFTWPEQGLVCEVDGWAAHGTRAAFRRDRRRSADLLVSGWRVVRFTYDDIVFDAPYVIRTLTALLAGGGAF